MYWEFFFIKFRKLNVFKKEMCEILSAEYKYGVSTIKFESSKMIL